MKTEINIDRILLLSKMTTKQQNLFIPELLVIHPELLELFEIASSKNLRVPREQRETYKVPPNDIHKVDFPKVFKGISDYLGLTKGTHRFTETESLLVELAVSPRTFRLSPEQLKEILGFTREPYEILLVNVPKYLEDNKVSGKTYNICKICQRPSSMLLNKEICRSCYHSILKFTEGRNYEFSIQKTSFNFSQIKPGVELKEPQEVTYTFGHWTIDNQQDELIIRPNGHPEKPLEIPLEFYEFVRHPSVI